MFSVYCRSHGARVLLGPDDVVELLATPGGVAVRWRCTCGEVGLWSPARATGGVAAAA